MISLKSISRDNWRECCDLKVWPEQERFVRVNVYALAESQFYPKSEAMGVYSGEQMVGFVVYGLEEPTGRWKIFQLMIDHRYQKQGYGREALKLVIDRLSGNPECADVYICYQSDNAVAQRLYAGFGFIEIGKEPSVLFPGREKILACLCLQKKG